MACARLQGMTPTAQPECLAGDAEEPHASLLQSIDELLTRRLESSLTQLENRLMALLATEDPFTPHSPLTSPLNARQVSESSAQQEVPVESEALGDGRATAPRSNSRKNTSSDVAAPATFLDSVWARLHLPTGSNLGHEQEHHHQQQARSIARDKSINTSVEEAHAATVMQKIVHSNIFEIAFASIIVANSLVVGVEVEVNARGHAETTVDIFLIMRLTFSFAYILELLCRFAADGCQVLCRSAMGPWYLFDLLLVIASLPEIVLDIMVLISPSLTQRMSFQSLRVLRLIKITRLTRTFRIPRIIRFISQLQVLIHSIKASLRALCWALFLLAMIMYICGIILMQVVFEEVNMSSPDTDPSLRKHWGSLTSATMTLFQCVSGGISWYEVYDPLYNISWLLSSFFVAYLAFTYFCVLNVVTGVFCSTAIESAGRDPDVIAKQIKKLNQDLRRHATKVFTLVDKGNTGSITITELEAAVDSNPEVTVLLELMQLDVSDVWAFFKLLDQDGSFTIEIDEFLEGVSKLRGTAKTIDIVDLMKQAKLQTESLREIMSKVSSQGLVISALAAHVEKLGASGFRRNSISGVQALTHSARPARAEI